MPDESQRQQVNGITWYHMVLHEYCMALQWYCRKKEYYNDTTVVLQRCRTCRSSAAIIIMRTRYASFWPMRLKQKDCVKKVRREGARG